MLRIPNLSTDGGVVVELPVIVVVVWMGWISMPFTAVKEVFVTGH